MKLFCYTLMAISNQGLISQYLKEYYSFGQVSVETSTMYFDVKDCKENPTTIKSKTSQLGLVNITYRKVASSRPHKGVFCQFLFWWIYYYDSNESTGKETGKTHPCGLVYYSILDSLDQRSQQISIKFSLHKQSENPKMCY